MSLRAISAELAARGIMNEGGRPFSAASIASMLERRSHRTRFQERKNAEEKSGIGSDCVAGVVGLELRNVVAKYPFERSHGFPGIQPNLATETLRVWRLGFGGVDPEATGRPAYHPSVLLKLYIYGYLHRVQSSRRLEREAGRNVEVMWLTGRLAPITRRLLISARITVLRSARCMRDLTSRRPLGAREFSQRSRRPSRYAPAMLIP
jgi:hypothetical protein